jgi:hypothetical protein
MISHRVLRKWDEKCRWHKITLKYNEYAHVKIVPKLISASIHTIS